MNHTFPARVFVELRIIFRHISLKHYLRLKWTNNNNDNNNNISSRRSQWPRGLRRGSAAAHLLGLWVRILPGAWMSVCCECCVLSGRGLFDGLINRPEESYRVCFVWVRSWSIGNEEALTHWGCRAMKENIPSLPNLNMQARVRCQIRPVGFWRTKW